MLREKRGAENRPLAPNYHSATGSISTAATPRHFVVLN